MDWLILENIKNCREIGLDLDTKMRLKEYFKKIVKDERQVRADIEKMVREELGENSKVEFKLMANKEKVDEDSH